MTNNTMGRSQEDSNSTRNQSNMNQGGQGGSDRSKSQASSRDESSRTLGGQGGNG